MPSRKIAIIFLALVSIGILLRSKPIAKINPSSESHPLIFYDRDQFYKSLEEATPPKSSKQIVGGIVPHHLLASHLIADLFKRLSRQKIKTVILIGPNHYEKGCCLILTSLYGWQTPFGVVEPQQEFIRKLVTSNFANVDEEVLPKEHSVAGIMPFVKFYLPDAKVVPLILRKGIKMSEVTALSKAINTEAGEGVVVVASVDFSHYLRREEAEKNDKFTWQVMLSKDVRQLLSMNNDYLDSPPSIAALLALMDLQGRKMELVANTNSGILMGDPEMQTTSYFEVIFH